MATTRTPAVFMRGGTSNGLFFHERDLPTDSAARDALLLSAFGSPDPYGRQLNGMGGGLSSLSKAIIVRKSTQPSADIDFLHGQVAVDLPLIDYSANCGNLSAAVGPFAIDEGLLPRPAGRETMIRIRNLNTDVLIEAHIPVIDGHFDPRGDFEIPGVPGSGARIGLSYLRPGAGDGGVLFPTGRQIERIDVGGQRLEFTIAHASLPVAWVRAGDLPLGEGISPGQLDDNIPVMKTLETIRREASVRLGMSASPASAHFASPKVGIVGAPQDYAALDGRPIAASNYDVMVRMISMERAHKAVPLTGAMCLAAACLAPGTTAHSVCRAPSGDRIRLGTPSGILTVGACLETKTPNPRIASTTVYSTARRLMDGWVSSEA